MSSPIPTKLCDTSYSQDVGAQSRVRSSSKFKILLPLQDPTEEAKEFKRPHPKRGRGRPRMYQEPELYTRNLRLDVSNKALIRAARRQFIEWFRLFFMDSQFYTAKAQVAKRTFYITDEMFEQTMQGFIPHIMQHEASDDESSFFGELVNLKEFLIVFIDPLKGPFIMFPGTDRLLADEMHGLFYSYNQDKLESFLALSEMRFVLHKTLNSQYISTLFAKNPRLSKNETLYTKCAEKLMNRVYEHNRTTSESLED